MYTDLYVLQSPGCLGDLQDLASQGDLEGPQAPTSLLDPPDPGSPTERTHTHTHTQYVMCNM